MNDDLATWAVVATYDEGFDAFYLWTPAEDVCLLTPDWKTDDKDDNIWGFFVSETEEGPCSFIEEQGWTYASYTYDEESDMQEPISITGPWGNEWIFKEEEEFASEYPSYAEEFGYIMYGADNTGCMDGNMEKIEDCECHESCGVGGSCGYYSWPTGYDDCINCPEGSTLYAIYSDGTGYCEDNLEWMNSTSMAAPPDDDDDEFEEEDFLLKDLEKSLTKLLVKQVVLAGPPDDDE